MNKYGYHRKCYSSYTNQKNLEKFPEIDNNSERRKSGRDKHATGKGYIYYPNSTFLGTTICNKSTFLGGSNIGRSSFVLPIKKTMGAFNLEKILAPKKCIICQNEKTNHTKSGYEKLVKCTTESSAKKLRLYGDHSDDEYAKAQLQTCSSLSEILAKDFFYHRSCYQDFSRPKSDTTTHSVENQTREECFNLLTQHILDVVVRNGQIVRIFALANLYATLQCEKGIPVMGTNNRNLKTRLVKLFGSKLTFFLKKAGTAEFVYSTETPTEHDNERSLFLMTDKEKVKVIATKIRQEINNQTDLFSCWPPPANEIKASRVVIPSLLTTLLQTLLSNDTLPSKRVNRLIHSLGQDIIYNSSCGKIKTIKHTQLGIITKRKTG